jgi:hypothetical protein
MFTVFGSFFYSGHCNGCQTVALRIYWSIVPLQPNAKKFQRVKFVSGFLSWGPTSLRPILPLLEHCWIIHNWCKSTVIKTQLSCCTLCSDSSRSLCLLNLEILLCRHRPLKLWKTELTVNESFQIIVCTCKPTPTHNVEARTKRPAYVRALIRGQVRLEGRWGLPVCTHVLGFRSM